MRSDICRVPFFKSLFAFCIGLVLCSVPFAIQAQEKAPVKKQQPVSQKEREKNFAEQMENTVLIGFFTLDSEEQAKPGKPERYEIRKISKAENNMWVFQSRIKYGSVDTVLPILLPIEWAGDTPIVSMTDFVIPGMGTFTCRVMFYKDRYAGTWQHGDKGGHMWGKIEKAEK